MLTNPDFWGGFPPEPRSALRNRQGIPGLSGVSSRAHEGETRGAVPGRDGVVRVSKAVLHEVSIVSLPSLNDALISAVRSLGREDPYEEARRQAALARRREWSRFEASFDRNAAERLERVRHAAGLKTELQQKGLI